MDKWCQSWKAHPCGRGEIKNVTWCITLHFQFQLSRGGFSNFLHLWTLSQENSPQVFEWRSIYKNIEQNVKDSCFWALCMAGILKIIVIMISSYYNLDLSVRPSVHPSVPHLLGHLWTYRNQTWQETQMAWPSYHTMQVPRSKFWVLRSAKFAPTLPLDNLEPHWQGASN